MRGPILPLPADDRAAVVTGASSGIGEAIAREFAARGHQVVVVARRVEPLRELAQSLGDRAHVVPADLSRRADRAELLNHIADLGLTPDILINNAGLAALGPVADSDVDAELSLIEVDVSAVVELCSRFVPGMVQRGRGAVLNVASLGAFGPLPGLATYGAAKAFVLSYTHSLRAELKNTGVTAATVCPGPVDTGFAEKAGYASGEVEGFMPKFLWKTPDEVARAAVRGLALGRAVIIPGGFNRVAAAAFHLTPRGILLPLIARTNPGA
jgi:uncharacterized protein